MIEGLPVFTPGLDPVLPITPGSNCALTKKKRPSALFSQPFVCFVLQRLPYSLERENQLLPSFSLKILLTFAP
jgi:hypothetical protein